MHKIQELLIGEQDSLRYNKALYFPSRLSNFPLYLKCETSSSKAMHITCYINKGWIESYQSLDVNVKTNCRANVYKAEY